MMVEVDSDITFLPDAALLSSLYGELGNDYTRRGAVTTKGDDQRFHPEKCREEWSRPVRGGHDHGEKGR
jgi:hypothetical protein